MLPQPWAVTTPAKGYGNFRSRSGLLKVGGWLEVLYEFLLCPAATNLQLPFAFPDRPNPTFFPPSRSGRPGLDFPADFGEDFFVLPAALSRSSSQ